MLVVGAEQVGEPGHRFLVHLLRLVPLARLRQIDRESRPVAEIFEDRGEHGMAGLQQGHLTHFGKRLVNVLKGGGHASPASA